MAIQTPPGWLQNAGDTHTAAQLRTYIGSMLSGNYSSTSTLRARGGLNPTFGTQCAVTQTGSPSMAVLVESGAGSIPGTESSTQGNYFFCNDAQVTLSIAAAHATLPRIDIVVVNIRDQQYSGASNDVQLQVITGTPASSPAVPTAPANSITLAQVAVAAAATSITNANITDTRFYMAALGGVIRSRNDAARPTTSEIVEGQLVWSDDVDRLYAHDGTNYRGIPLDFLPWTSYTPTWTTHLGGGSNPSIGNGTLAGRYMRIGPLVIMEVSIVFGSTTNGGTGIYFITLPLTASATAVTMSGGTWFALDLTTQEYSGTSKVEDTTKIRLVRDVGSVANNSPFTFANGDSFRIQFMYEPA